jgi:L-serine dehydratase
VEKDKRGKNMQYDSLKDLVIAAKEAGENISEIVIEDQMLELNLTRQELMRQMGLRFDTMVESIENGLHANPKSHCCICADDAAKFQDAIIHGKTLGGGIIDGLILRALAISGQNACMGKIVAAPTAGSCGIIPSVLLTFMELEKAPRQNMISSLFTAGAVGMVISSRASLSGAESGCQAECGSAMAMAAAALVELYGGTPEMAANACAIALKSALGLVCDPVAGLVEVPCIKRNATGAVSAWTAANMALAGIESVIPVDEVIDAMKSIGNLMSTILKETSEGGLAATPTARNIARMLLSN